ncbi:hypothetical protein [Novosphingobium decolorationis]|uniref:Uncharacterized protein n=1 Tax=Novosphingobium decolorationis TaxID=2698673 RepID=A0ABX8DZY5_9SPHN|nr:hypothetical protein [Novosphingobium decolorationis]QVM82383.1 hypothetical protein HT578_00535 [Novosphingobium decolorationis]
MAIEAPVGAPLKAALQKTLDRYRSDNVPVPETILATERGTVRTAEQYSTTLAAG